MDTDGTLFSRAYARRAMGEGGKPTDAPLVQALIARMTPGTAVEFDNADKPDPHLFMRGDEGLFPVGESTVMAGLQREGKTLALVGVATALRVGVNVGGLAAVTPGLGTAFITAEDSRAQMLRKIAAAAYAAEQRNGKAAGDAVRNSLFVLDLNDAVLSPTRAFVEVDRRQPQTGRIVKPLSEAIKRAERMRGDFRFGMAVCETASTLNDGDESNLSFRLMADAVRYVARECGLAGVLSHHLNQSAMANVRDLNVSVADIRGGTSLVFNGRQNIIAINVGCDRYPFPDNDKRTLLRGIVDGASPQHERGDKVVVLVPLDASKAATPPPIYLRQYLTPFGPALLPIPTPDVLAPLSWSGQVAYLRAASAGARADAKASTFDDEVRAVVEAVRYLETVPRPATETAVSQQCGHHTDWSRARLNAAVVDGRLFCHVVEGTTRRKKATKVYSTRRDSSAAEESAEDAQ